MTTKGVAYLQQVSKLAQTKLDVQGAKAELVEPFITTLGYNLANPYEIMMHFTDRVGKKKKEPVVYALNKEEEEYPHILIAPHATEKQVKLDKYPHLARLFNALPHVRLLILTDGIHFQLFADTQKPETLDEKPFWQGETTRQENADLLFSKLTKGQEDIDGLLALKA